MSKLVRVFIKEEFDIFDKKNAKIFGHMKKK